MAPVLLLLIAALAAPPASPGPFGPVERHVLDNRLTVLVAPDHSSPLVSVGVMYAVGARNEAAGSTGLAHYVEHMNFRATRRFPGTEITEAITRIGGRWNGYTWIDQTYYGETVHKDALDRMLDLERDRMADALFDAADFDRERTSVLAELRSYDDPRSVLYDAVLAASFEIHPYRHNTIGWRTDVEAVTRDEAYRFYRRFYHPNNAVLVIVGDVPTRDALAKVRARFADLPPTGEPTRVRTVEPEPAGERRVVVRHPGPHARVLAAFRAPALTDPDFPVMVLLDALVAGGKGFRFTRDYPEDDTAPFFRAASAVAPEASAHTQWQASRDPYVYTLAVDVPGEDALTAAEDAIFRTLQDAAVREWTDTDLARARRQVVTGWASDLDDKAGRAHQLAFFEVSGGYAYLLDMPERLARVARHDVQRFARERLTRERSTVGWFVPAPPASPATSAPPAPAPAVTPAPRPAVAAPVVAAPASTELQSLRLRNGLAVTLAPGAGGALVSLRGRIEAGSMFDGALPGLSALATELLARPVPGQPPAVAPLTWTLHEAPDAPEAHRWIEFSASTLPADLDDALRDVTARLQRGLRVAQGGAIPRAEWDALRAAAAHRARTNDAVAATALWRRALAETFPSPSPLRHPAWGEAREIESTSPDVLRAFLRGHVRPGAVTLVLAGALDVPATRIDLARQLGALPSVAASVSEPSLGLPRGAPEWHVTRLPRPGKSQDDIRVVVAADRSQPWDATATELLLYLLGETGYAGRLGHVLVEPGLVYSVHATREAQGTTGFLMVRTASAPQDTPEVLRRIRSVLEQAARGAFTEAELGEARGYLRGKRAREREGSAAAARDVLEDAPSAAAPAPEAVSLDQLNDTARRLFRNGAPVAIVSGPPEG